MLCLKQESITVGLKSAESHRSWMTLESSRRRGNLTTSASVTMSREHAKGSKRFADSMM